MSGARPALSAAAEHEQDGLRADLAESYKDAVLAAVDMHLASPLLERAQAAIRALGLAAPQAINALVSEATNAAPLAAILARLRDRAAAAALRLEIAQPEETRPQAIASALDMNLYQLAVVLAENTRSAQRETLVAGTRHALHARWREAVPMIDLLTGDETIDPATRSHLLTGRAMVDVQIFRDADAAAAHVAAADDMLADQWQTFCARAAIAQMADTADSAALAEQHYQRANELAQGRAALPLARLGALMLACGQLLRAEQCFQQAAHATDDPSLGYRSLIDLAGQPNLFAGRRTQIADLVRCAELVALSVSDHVDALMAAAEAHRKNGATAEAAAFCDSAIALDEARIDALLGRGHAALDAKALDAARQDFERASKAAPDSADVAWALTLLAEAEADWDGMVQAALRARHLAPDWGDGVVERLEQAAKNLYRSAPDSSAHILAALRTACGDSYEVTYRNLLGNLRYAQGNYSEAAACYRASAARAPAIAQYHANLAQALEKLPGELPKAVQAASEANRLEPGKSEFAGLARRLSATEAMVARYGEAARTLTPENHRIRVGVPARLLSQVVAEDASLSSAIQARVAGLRESIKRQYGFTLCGVNFTDIPAAEPVQQIFVEIAGERLPQSAGDGGGDDVGDALEQAVRGHLPALFGHDEARSTAQSCPDSAWVDSDAARLNGLTQAMRTWLGGHDGLPDPAVRHMVQDARPLQPRDIVSHPLDAPAVISILLAPDTTSEMTDPTAWQAELFRRCGVIVAPPVIQTADVPTGKAILQIGGNRHILAAETAFLDGLSLLQDSRAALLEAHSLPYLLSQLRQSAPALAATTERLLPGDSLVSALREQLIRHGSIRNLHVALERILLPTD